MTHALDTEAKAIIEIVGALSSLEDDEARRRVLAYVSARFRLSEPLSKAAAFPGEPPTAVVTSRELAGVAILTENGELKITARDLKARSGLDAAVRLAHVAIYANEKLTGRTLSSRKGLTPILKAYRVYDGNTRARLAREKGIVRNGDELSLDTHARHTAEAFVAEMLDDDVKGSWKPR